MIISRTPMRVSFFGGGTDYPGWYEDHGGSVVSTSIDKYCYITCRYLPPFFDHKFRIRYTKREETQTIKDINHPSVRACLEYMKIKKGVEIVHSGDLPALTGLGSSSAFTVGLLHTLFALKGKIVNKQQLAMGAIHIEQDIIKENVGSQDQVAAAFGGFNRIDFKEGKTIDVHPITLHSEKMQELQCNLMMFFTGFSRFAHDIAGAQINNIPKKKKELKLMSQMVNESIKILNGSKIDDFGRLLNESWKIKRTLSHKITTDSIDEIYNAGIKAGALGGKILGAGGGGFILFFVKPEKQPKVRKALQNFLHVPFKFEELGSQIVYYKQSEYF